MRGGRAKVLGGKGLIRGKDGGRCGEELKLGGGLVHLSERGGKKSPERIASQKLKGKERRRTNRPN